MKATSANVFTDAFLPKSPTLAPQDFIRTRREFIVDVRVLDLPKNWAVGQRAEVYIESGRKKSVPLLPAAAVVWRGDGFGVAMGPACSSM